MTFDHSTLSQHPPSHRAARLAYAGLVPFVGGTLFIWLLVGKLEPEPFMFVVDALTGYAALVASFLGGMTWGLVMRAGPGQEDSALTRRVLTTGVAYALTSWVALCMPPHAGLVVLGSLLIACYVNDRHLYTALGAGGWLHLRFRLTAVASLCCFLAAAQL